MIEATLPAPPTGAFLRETLRAIAEPVSAEAPASRWPDDLHFFAIVYLAGLVFFLLVIA